MSVVKIKGVWRCKECKVRLLPMRKQSRSCPKCGACYDFAP